MSQNEEIVKLHRSGMRPVDIAHAIGTSEWTIHHRLNRMGVERRSRGLSTARLADAALRYESGDSLRQISNRLGFNDKTVKKALVKAGVNMRDRRP